MVVGVGATGVVTIGALVTITGTPLAPFLRRVEFAREMRHTWQHMHAITMNTMRIGRANDAPIMEKVNTMMRVARSEAGDGGERPLSLDRSSVTCNRKSSPLLVVRGLVAATKYTSNN